MQLLVGWDINITSLIQFAARWVGRWVSSRSPITVTDAQEGGEDQARDELDVLVLYAHTLGPPGRRGDEGLRLIQASV